MREYSMDFEDKLEKAHAAIGGGVKKFGYENINRNSAEEGQEIFEEKFDRDLDKMNRHASKFIKESTLPPKPENKQVPKVMGRLPFKATTTSSDDLMK
jgi:hypothetical protein